MDVTAPPSPGEVNNTQSAAAPIAPATIVAPLLNPILIKGGVQIDNAPNFPLVAINKCADVPNGYNLFITIIIPAGSDNISLDTNFTSSISVLTEVSPTTALIVREITIDYDSPDTESDSSGYDIYLIECTYQVGTGTEAQAVYVHYTYNDPVTTRGTITTVMTT